MKTKCPCNDMMCVHVSVIIKLVNYFRGKTKEWRDFIFCTCSFLVSTVTFHTFMCCWQPQWKDESSVTIRLYLVTLMTFALIIKQSSLGCLWSWWRDSSSLFLHVFMNAASCPQIPRLLWMNFRQNNHPQTNKRSPGGCIQGYRRF